jgi:hypothetical protein
LFAEFARGGQLAPDAEARLSAPGLAHWCDLQRLVGLLWEERWHEALQLGEKLTASVDRERQEDEALSLTAYALLWLGRGDDAIAMLERAMAGSYTEALLVNLSIAASRAKPAVAASHFARIVNEAPSRELKIAALRRAVEVWTTTTETPTFPNDLIEPLRAVLAGECSVEDYVTFAGLASQVARPVLIGLPDPGGERSPIYRVLRARARLGQDGFDLIRLAKEFIAVYREVGRPGWFNDQWHALVADVRQSIFVPFGDAPGSATFIDNVFSECPELFTQHDRFVLLPQAGAHLASYLAKGSNVLSSEAIDRFFFRPIGEFLAEKPKLDPGTLGSLADNFHTTLFIAGLETLSVGRQTNASTYNSLVQRLAWDSTNKYLIVNEMRNVLADNARQQADADKIAERLGLLPVDSVDSRKRLETFNDELADWRTETLQLQSNL